ncbi:MAG: F0F1 ATP synthase subunit B [Candidatus Promineifilaceae bacterium]
MEGLGINLGYFLQQAFAFLILVLALTGWLYRPILNNLEERKSRIAKGLEDARQAALARENADVEAKKVLDEARQEAAKIRADASLQADETAAGITSQANNEAKAILARAREDAEQERNRVMADLRGQIAAISMAAANKLVGESLDENRQRQIIADFFAQAPADFDGLQGDEAEVTSAVPLTEAEQGRLRTQLKAGEVRFKVDPGILGGLIVRVGDQVLDDSVASQMGELREAMAR